MTPHTHTQETHREALEPEDGIVQSKRSFSR